MTVREFGDKMRLKVRQDECGDDIVPGKRGHIYLHSDKQLGLCLLYNTPRPWTFAKRKLAEYGYAPSQDGDTEGTFVLAEGFSLAKPSEGIVRLVLKLASIKRRRTPSPAQLETLKKARAAHGKAVCCFRTKT